MFWQKDWTLALKRVSPDPVTHQIVIIGTIVVSRECILFRCMEAQGCRVQCLITKLPIACPDSCPFAFRTLTAIAFKSLCDSGEFALSIAQCATSAAHLPMLLSTTDPYPGSYRGNGSIWTFNQRRD